MEERIKGNNIIKMNDKIKQKKNTLEKEEFQKEEDNMERSKFSMEGGKGPFSLYTRRVLNTNKIREYLNEQSIHGLCGSINLGNTCFMNSSIACLSNCIELTCYFLSKDYIKDINKNNKSGMNGRLAEAWADLINEYWVLHTRVGDPSEFKKTIGSKIKRFSGFNQQDSNEFIDLFLDNLNEDLNAVTNKNYIELKEKGENETDEQCSKRFWDNYLKRNDSIITDLFCGQLKCIITCPKCNFVNITFDPFSTLNLNIPDTKNREHGRKEYLSEFKIFYVPKYCIRTPLRIVFKNILKKATFKDCFNCLKKQDNYKYNKSINKLFINKIADKKSIEFINQESKKTIKEYGKKFYFCYDIINEEEDIYIPLYCKDNKGLSEFPRVIMVSQENSNLDDIRKKIYLNIRKFILSPLKKENDTIDLLSNQINDYITNNEIKDDYILDLINKEYQEVFNNTDYKYIQDFIKDLPFKLYLTNNLEDKDEKKVYIIDENNFLNLSKEFYELTNIKEYKEPIKGLLKLIKNEKYNFVVELINNSKYINEKLYKLNNCIKYVCNFSEKEDEEKNKVITLKNCFELFIKEEKLKEGDEWYCPRCEKFVLANKKMEIYYSPKILIVCFKRFIKNSYAWERNDELIYFPIENLDMKDFIVGPDKGHSKYDLFAVSMHYGGTGSGHYTAICKNFNKWYSYNDSSIYEINPENVLSSAAYVLFYRRQTD